MKRLLVTSMFAAASIVVVVPSAASASTTAFTSVLQDKPDKVTKAKNAKKAKKELPAQAAPRARRANRSEPPRWGLNPLQRAGGVALAERADSEKVTICHRTSSATNPYVQITPATAGVANGHDGHSGPIYSPTLEPSGTKWGDIIPPYVFRGVQYPGQNWSEAGQAIFDNGCDLPDEVDGPPIVVATVAPSVLPPTCEEDGRLVLPTDENVFYTSVPAGTGRPGVHTVTARPEVGHVLSGQTRWVLEVEPMLSGLDCLGVAGVSLVDGAVDGAVGDVVDDDSLLPDTGGAFWWILVMGGLLTAAGVALAAGARRRS